MSPIGKKLQEAREKKGYTLWEAEEATKIRYLYLEALEQNAYDKLPGRVYGIGFLRNYANFLGLDGQSLIEEFKKDYKDEEPPILDLEKQEGSENPPKRSGILAVGIAVGILVVIVAITSLINDDSQGVNKPVSSPSAPSVSTPSNNNESAMPTSDPSISKPEQSISGSQDSFASQGQSQNMTLTLVATGGKSWVEVRADGKSVFAGTIFQGETKTFYGLEKIYCKVGNAGAVEAQLNGQNLGLLGKEWDVVEREFTRSNSLH